MHYPNTNIPVCSGLTRRVSAGDYRGVCSSANPKQNVKQTQSGTVLREVVAQRSCIAQGRSKSKLNPRAAVGCGQGLGDSIPLPPCCVGGTAHSSAPLPCANNVEHQKLLWNYSLKHLFLVEGFWLFTYKP